MKILHVIDHLGLGGAQTVLAELLRCWPEAQDHIEVVALGKQTELLDQFRAIPQVRVEVLGGARWNPLVSRRVAGQIRRGGYDIVHGHLTKSIATILSAARRSKSHFVIHLQNDPTTDHFLLRAAIRRWTKRVDGALAVSKQTKASAAVCFPGLADRLQVLHNGIDFAELDAVPACQSLRTELGFAQDDIVLGFAGRLAEQKGVVHLLRAMASVVGPRPDVKLIVMGDGPLRGSLQAEAARSGVEGNVRFVGFRHDVRSWMQKLDIGVLPSLHEGTSLTLIEMLGYGLPVIATRVSGTPEVIRHDHNGLLVEPRNDDGLAAAILRYTECAELRERHGRAARADVRQRFCARRISTELRELYASFAGDVCSRQEARTGYPTKPTTESVPA